MALSTVVYFGVGGLFVGLYANAVRHLPLLRSRPKTCPRCQACAGAVDWRPARS
jgi:hypothetical protein